MNSREFLYASKYYEKIIKGLKLTKPLLVASIIIGPEHTGKKTLAKKLFKKATFIDAKKLNNIEKAMSDSDSFVIYNFEHIKNIDAINFENRSILALANHKPPTKKLEQIFSFIYEIPPLSRREEDLFLLIEHFKKLAIKELSLPQEQIENLKIQKEKLDLSSNNKSLRASIFKQALYSTLQREDLEEILYEYFLRNIQKESSYTKNLSLFEIPYIKAGLEKYKSQLQLSNAIGINRNTLRKKIDEYNIK